MRLLPLVLLTLGCPKPDTQLANVWNTTPRLPAPAAGAYTRSKEAPTDPALAPLVEGKQWDASLSGAAGTLAVSLSNPNGPKALTRWAVREALWRAGYPYPITDAKAWLANEDNSPPPQMLAWLEHVDATEDLGLVRSRGHDDDVFVALKARPSMDLPPIPRQLAVGGTLRLPAVPNGSYSIADANGRPLTGSLQSGAEIDVPFQGEWLVRIDADGKPVATFPVYVGIVPPTATLIERTVPVREEADVLNRATELLARIRTAYGSPAPSRDFMLDAGARTLLDNADKRRDDVLTSLGVSPEEAAVWTCADQTVEVCIDGMIWRPENRLALLDDDARLGLATRVDATGVHLVGILTRTD